MRKLLTLWIVLAVAAFAVCGPASAQGGMGPGPGTVHSTGGSYTGPGDIKSGAIFWIGLRAYSAAYAASHGNVVQLCNSSGAGCTIVTANTNGSITLPGATACGGSACDHIKTLYDQSGNGNDEVQTTAANMPALSTANLGGLPTAVFASTNSSCLTGGTTATLSTPLTYSFVMDKVADGGINFSYFGLNIQLSGSPNKIRMFDGSNVVDATAADGSFHAAQFIDTGSGAGASQAYIDGSTTAGTMSGSGTTSGNIINIGSNQCVNNFTDQILAEVGFWNADFSSPDVRTTMNSNQHTYWGF
jgi:hypothetical protein